MLLAVHEVLCHLALWLVEHAFLFSFCLLLAFSHRRGIVEVFAVLDMQQFLVNEVVLMLDCALLLQFVKGD